VSFFVFFTSLFSFCNFLSIFSAQRGEPIAAKGVTGYQARGDVRPDLCCCPFPFFFLNFPFLFDLPKKQIGGTAGGKSRGTRYPQPEARGPVGARESACEGCGVVGGKRLAFCFVNYPTTTPGRGDLTCACGVPSTAGSARGENRAREGVPLSAKARAAHRPETRHTLPFFVAFLTWPTTHGREGQTGKRTALDRSATLGSSWCGWKRHVARVCALGRGSEQFRKKGGGKVT
jgi:hypothetical protein